MPRMTIETLTLSTEALDYISDLLAVDDGENIPSVAVALELAGYFSVVTP